jgi:tetratricopeptide (TPR) repeat protein
LDTSASQAGEYRADGIASLKALLAGLKAEDRVQLIAVDVNAVPLSEGFVRPAGDEISRALQRLEQRVPLGATDMEKALQSAAGAFEEGARRKAAVYIGDGINAATGFLGTESFDSVVSNLVQKRIPVSSHGIGPRVDVRVLNALAAQTGGRVVADWDKEGPEEAGAALAAAANAPVLWPQQDQVVFPGGFEVYPMQMPPLRTDRDTVLIGKYAGGQKGPFDVQATVSTPQGPKEVKWSVAPNPTSEDNAFLVQLVEMAQVDGGRSLPVLGSESLAKIRQEINAGVYTTSQLAAQVFNSGNLDDAERLAKATQQYDPGNPEALAILRAVAKKRGADATQPEALELLGPRVGPTEDRAFQQMIETETRKTIEIAHRTMEFAPELAVQNLKQQLETIIRTTGLDPDRVDQLVDQLQAAIRQARQRLMVKAYVDRGESRLSKKDYDGAIAEFSEAIRLQPDCVNAYYFRGLAWYDKRDYDRAIKDLDQAIRLQPNDAVAYSMRGAAWREKRDYDRAIKDGDQAIRLQPDSAVGYHLRGVAWYDKQDYDRAMKDFDEAIRLNPNNAKAYVWRGRTKRDAGDTKGAEADLARARQLGWEPP